MSMINRRNPKKVGKINREIKETKFTHLSKTLLKYIPKHTKQGPTLGFSVGGRPNGMWVARGYEWVNFTRGLGNKHFPSCCYFYDIYVDASRLCHITPDNFDQFDEQVGNYWLNMDYYDIDVVDYYQGEHIVWHKKIHTAADEENKVFWTREDALKCEFYSVDPTRLDRFRFKNWGEIHADGVAFEFDQNSDAYYYIWYQNLEVSCACIWNMKAISSYKLMYEKIKGEWKKL